MAETGKGRKGHKGERVVVPIPKDWKHMSEEEKRRFIGGDMAAAIGSLVAPETGDAESEELPDDHGLQAIAAGTVGALTERCSDPDDPGVLRMGGLVEDLGG